MTRDYTRGGEPSATWTDETTVFTSGACDFDHDGPCGEDMYACPDPEQCASDGACRHD